MKVTKEGWCIIDGDTHIGKWVEENKRLDFDQNTLPLILQHIESGDTVIDAGANIGCYSYAFLNKVGDNGNVFCFEPNKIAYECLEQNINKPNAYLFNYALSNRHTRSDVINENDNFGMAFTVENEQGDIKTVTLDSFSDYLNRVDFIKIDVEGNELEVLQGCEEIIFKYRPILYIEINTHTLNRKGITPNFIYEFLLRHRYDFNNIYPKQGLDGEQFDIICTPII